MLILLHTKLTLKLTLLENLKVLGYSFYGPLLDNTCFVLVCAIPLKVLIKEKNRCPVSEILFRQAAKPAQLSGGLAVSEVGWLAG